MDIRCRKCSEPWDADSLHEEVSARHPSEPWKVNGTYDQALYDPYYDEVRREFYAKGCVALTGFTDGCPTSERTESQKDTAAITSALMDVLGDDVDGLASELDDLRLR